MKVLLIIHNSAFETCQFIIDPTTLSFYGKIDDYDYDDRQSFNSISFVLDDVQSTTSVVEETKKRFRYREGIEKYISVKTKFEVWETDTRPRISIHERGGIKGLRSPLEFHLKTI